MCVCVNIKQQQQKNTIKSLIWISYTIIFHVIKQDEAFLFIIFTYNNNSVEKKGGGTHVGRMPIKKKSEEQMSHCVSFSLECARAAIYIKDVLLLVLFPLGCAYNVSLWEGSIHRGSFEMSFCSFPLFVCVRGIEWTGEKWARSDKRVDGGGSKVYLSIHSRGDCDSH